MKNFEYKKYFSLSFIISLVVFCVFSVVLFYGMRQKSQSFYFQDETDHVTMGWMIDKFDKKLYQDLSTNHQPIPVITGAVAMKLVPYQTLFDLIERLRIGLFVGFFVLGVLTVIRFRLSGAFAYLLTYSVGFYFFAWHVLGESLVVPAIIWIFLYLFKVLFTKKTQKLGFEKVDSIALAVSFFLVIFSLLPLWPFCLLAGVYVIVTFTQKQRIIAASLFVILTVALFTCISPSDWYRETIYNNTHYLIPDQKMLSVSETAKIIFYPFLSFLHISDRLAQMFLLPAAFLLGMIGYLLLKYKKQISLNKASKILYLYLLLISLNTRVFDFPVAFYKGFHLFPFVAAFFTLFGTAFEQFLYSIKIKKLFFLCLLLPLGIFFINLPWAFEKKDKLNEYYVQYGTQDSYARLIGTLEQPNDTFFSGPDGYGYINIMSGLPIAGRQLFHLQWAYRSPVLRGEFHHLFSQSPPTFILLYEDESGYHADLQSILDSQYKEFLHDGKRTHLYLKNERTVMVSDVQKQYMQEKDFSFAE